MIVRNASANIVGMGVTILTQAVMMIAAYRLAGPEQYGLIGFFGTLLTGAAILDVGLGQTVVREIARRRSVVEGVSDTKGATLYTFQALYGGIVCAVIVGLLAASPLIAHFWLKPKHIPAGEVQAAVMLMGVAIGVQRLRIVYQSTLDGLERQVLSNSLMVGTNLLRMALGLGALLFVAPTAEAYFSGQIIASLVETATFAIMAWRALPAPELAPRRFDRTILRESAAFAGTNAAGAALGTAIQIADAIVISAVMPLAVFGSYSLVSQLCSMMLRLVTPLLNAVLPRMALYVRENRREDLAKLFFTYSQALAGLLAASVGVLACFGGAVLLLLTGKPAVAQMFAPVVGLLSAAYAFNGLSRCPHGLQLAEGNPLTALQVNIVQGAIYLPAIAILTPKFGIATPASILLIANGMGFLVFTWQGFNRMLRGMAFAWLIDSVARPALAAGAVCLIVRLVIPTGAPLFVQLGAAVFAGGLALAASAMATSRLRTPVLTIATGFLGRAGLRRAHDASLTGAEPRGRP